MTGVARVSDEDLDILQYLWLASLVHGSPPTAYQSCAWLRDFGITSCDYVSRVIRRLVAAGYVKVEEIGRKKLRKVTCKGIEALLNKLANTDLPSILTLRMGERYRNLLVLIRIMRPRPDALCDGDTAVIDLWKIISGSLGSEEGGN
ncbi:hypothetical protein [Vulcanisaeta distributa]|uniref:hypothetical protein n=1 Tax=Vulcanisaeta distributa TaxID=164451 RepID=UPI0006D286BD|nr:hypothetical protein [Vulcanisaeta distributa]